MGRRRKRVTINLQPVLLKFARDKQLNLSRILELQLKKLMVEVILGSDENPHIENATSKQTYNISFLERMRGMSWDEVHNKSNAFIKAVLTNEILRGKKTS